MTAAGSTEINFQFKVSVTVTSVRMWKLLSTFDPSPEGVVGSNSATSVNLWVMWTPKSSLEYWEPTRGTYFWVPMGTIFTVFGMTQPGIESTTYQSQGGHCTTRPLRWSVTLLFLREVRAILSHCTSPVVSLSDFSQSRMTNDGQPSTVTTVRLDGGTRGGLVTFWSLGSSSGK